VIGGAILWLAERNGGKTRSIGGLTFPAALGIGAAQAVALVPGISRSGISISAGLFAGLDRESAARFSFLMATPVTALAAAYEARKLLTGEAGLAIAVVPLIVGMVASLIAGLFAIGVLLRFVRSHSTDVFVAYRVVLAAVVVVAWLGLGR
jgi:undecaprenyl-diphosphatase